MISAAHPPHPALLALTPFELALTTLWGECRGEPVEGQIAVANVLRNRLRDGRWGRDYQNVILDWAEFSCLWESLDRVNFSKVLTFVARIRRPETFDRREAQLRWIVQGLFADAILDNTYGSTHYYADYIEQPFWAKPPATLAAKYGKHLFWGGVR